MPLLHALDVVSSQPPPTHPDGPSQRRAPRLTARLASLSVLFGQQLDAAGRRGCDPVRCGAYGARRLPRSAAARPPQTPRAPRRGAPGEPPPHPDGPMRVQQVWIYLAIAH